MWLCFSVTEFNGVFRHNSDYCVLCASKVTVFSHHLLTVTVFKQYGMPCLPISLLIKFVPNACLPDIFQAAITTKRTPWCFKNVHYQPCEYHYNVKAWMMDEVFKECILSLEC